MYCSARWLSKLKDFLIFVKNCDLELANCNFKGWGGNTVQYDVWQILKRLTVLWNTHGCWVSHSGLLLIWNATEMDTICGGQSVLWIVGVQTTRKGYAQRIISADEVIHFWKSYAIAFPTHQAWLADDVIPPTAILPMVHSLPWPSRENTLPTPVPGLL